MTIIRTKKRIFGSSKLKKIDKITLPLQNMVNAVRRLPQIPQVGAVSTQVGPRNDIISTKVNLFDTFWTRLNLTSFPQHLQLSTFISPFRSPPPQTGPAFSASCSEDPATTQVWSSGFNKSCIVFGIFNVANIFGLFSKYSQHLWSTTS